MNAWAERTKEGGALLFDDGLVVYESPKGADIDKCFAWGEKLAAF